MVVVFIVNTIFFAEPVARLESNDGIFRSEPVILKSDELCLSLIYYITPNSSSKITISLEFNDESQSKIDELRSDNHAVNICLHFLLFIIIVKYLKSLVWKKKKVQYFEMIWNS